MLFNAIFVSLFVAGWLICGFLPWLALSVWTRGHAGLALLPLCMFTGVVAGLSVPILGLDGASGVPISMAAAAIVPAMLLVAQRFALPATAERRAVTAPPAEQQPK